VERIETQFESSVLNSELDIRETVNEAYESIAKTMFDSLQAIARDTTSHQTSNTKDDDEKEQLDSHISMIENMHYYRETVDDRGIPVLINFKTKAQTLFVEHLGMYLRAVIRRPLGRLLVAPLISFTNKRTSYKV
jgi:exocyst complex component 1